MKTLYICKCGNICENGICLGCLEKENPGILENIWKSLDQAYNNLSVEREYKQVYNISDDDSTNII